MCLCHAIHQLVWLRNNPRALALVQRIEPMLDALEDPSLEVRAYLHRLRGFRSTGFVDWDLTTSRREALAAIDAFDQMGRLRDATIMRSMLAATLAYAYLDEARELAERAIEDAHRLHSNHILGTVLVYAMHVFLSEQRYDAVKATAAQLNTLLTDQPSLRDTGHLFHLFAQLEQGHREQSYRQLPILQHMERMFSALNPASTVV